MANRPGDAGDAKNAFCPFILIRKGSRRIPGKGKIIRIKVKNPFPASPASPFAMSGGSA
jgi:hypothetical protein